MCARAAHAAVTCWLEHHQAGGVSHATAVMQYPCTPDLAHAALQVTRHMQQQRDACSHGQLTFAHAMSKMVLLCASHLARGGLSWSVYRLVGSSSAEVSTIDTQPSSSPTVRNLQLFATCNSRSRQGISRVSYATAAAVVVAARMADCWSTAASCTQTSVPAADLVERDGVRGAGIPIWVHTDHASMLGLAGEGMAEAAWGVGTCSRRPAISYRTITSIPTEFCRQPYVCDPGALPPKGMAASLCCTPSSAVVCLSAV